MSTTLKRNDSGFYIDFLVKYADNTPIDLTGSTIVFKMAAVGSATNKVSGSCTIVSAEAGTCKYLFATNDLNTAGRYKAELQITWASPAKVLTADLDEIIVEPDLPA